MSDNLEKNTPNNVEADYAVLRRIYEATRLKLANYSVQIVELETLLELEKEKVTYLAKELSGSANKPETESD